MSTITVSAGETLSGITISAFVSAAVESGGVLEDSTILSGGRASIGIGADAAKLVVSGGTLFDDGNIIDTEVIDSGYFSVSDGTAENTVVSGGMMVVEDGERHFSAVARNITVEAGGTLMADIAFVSATTVKADAVMYSEGTAAGVTVSRGGALIAQDGTVTGATIGSGGVGFAGNAAVAGVIEAGSTFVVSASIGPYGLAQTSANLSGLTADAGATVIVAGGAVETGLTLLPGVSIQHAGVTVTSNTEGGPRLRVHSESDQQRPSLRSRSMAEAA
jgi:hypothetical protein